LKKSTIDILDSGMWECYCGPRGDPDRAHIRTAAFIIKAFQNEGIKIDRTMLSFVKGKNAGKLNALKEVENELKPDTEA
jgi:hypothetical protein